MFKSGARKSPDSKGAVCRTWQSRRQEARPRVGGLASGVGLACLACGRAVDTVGYRSPPPVAPPKRGDARSVLRMPSTLRQCFFRVVGGKCLDVFGASPPSRRGPWFAPGALFLASGKDATEKKGGAKVKALTIFGKNRFRAAS